MTTAIPMNERKALKLKDAAAVLSVSVATIKRLETEGLLTPVPLGGVKRYATNDLDKLLQPCTIAVRGGHDAAEM